MMMFSEYKVKQWKRKGLNHMVKATEALREGGGCLPFVRNISSGW
jgi:hypothetical protein